MTLEAGIAVGGGLPFLGSEYEIRDELQIVHDLGATWVRPDIQWTSVETADGTFDWSDPDRIWNACKFLNLKILWVVHLTPSWARGGAGTTLTYPTTVSHYGDFCAAAAARYPGCAWELWNEPNGTWGATDVSTTGAQKLASMVADAAPKIRAADSTALVIGPGILRGGTAGSGTYRLDTEYLGDMYAGDLDPGDLDYLGYHPYAIDPHVDPTSGHANNGWNTVDDYVAVARTAGDTTIKAWMTEVGYHTYVAAGSRPGATEAEQSTYLSSAFTVWKALAASGYVDGPLFWYQHKDTASTYSDADGEDAYGLIKYDRVTKKTAYTTYQTEVASLYAAEYRFRVKVRRSTEETYEDVSVPIISGATMAAPLGGLTAAISAVVEHPATMAAPLGALTGGVTALVTVLATFAAPLGAITGSVTAGPDKAATMAAPLGSLTGAATIVASHPATLAAPLGALTSSITAVVVVPATLAAPLGALTGTVTALVTVIATFAAPLGQVTGAFSATVSTPGGAVSATMAAPLGLVTASITASVTVPATFAAPLGAVTGTVTATVTVLATFAAPLGSVTANIAALVTVSAVFAAPLGSLTSATTAVVVHVAAFAAPLGQLTVSLSAVPTVVAAFAAPLGAVLADVAAARTIDAVYAATLGPLVATLIATIFSPGVIAAERTKVIAQHVRSLVVQPSYRRLIVPPATRSTIGH